jgi:hypothetical protein
MSGSEGGEIVDIEKTRAQEIVRLHSEVVGHLRQSLEKAIRIGQLLSEQKEALKHGEFIPWLESNIPFTDRTARNYMKVYRERDRLKTETISDLKGAYALLASPQEESFNPDEWFKAIKEANNIFFQNLPEYRIDTEPGGVFWLLKKKDDGSMTEREKRGFSLWVNFHTHLCYWINFAKAKGKDNLHPQLRRYIDVVMEHKPNWINEPLRICGEKCGRPWSAKRGAVT